jgi:integrase
MENQGLKTVSQIEKATKNTVKTTPYAIAGYIGLFLSVEVSQRTGKKTAIFKHRYSHPILKGKRPTITLGQYPAFTLEQARQAYNDNLALLAKGIDPIEHRQAEQQKALADRQNTLQYFIDEWWQIQRDKKIAPQTLQKLSHLVKPISDKLGKSKVTDIKPSDVIRFIKGIQKTYPAKGLEVRTILKNILQIAKANGVIEYNPASDLQGTLKPHKQSHRPAITTPAEFGKLLNDIDSLADSPIFQKEILQLLALTFARIGDICAMKWADINLFTKQWEFRPQKAGNRDDMSDLITPLSRHAIAILERMQPKTGGYEYVFYNGRRKAQKHTHKQEINKILNSPAMNDGQGYKDIHSPHGFRASAKTMLMERLGYDELITELQLGHRMMNSYGRAYSRMDMLEQRRAMLTDWANYLDQLKAGKVDNVIYLDKVKTNQQAINE